MMATNQQQANQSGLKTSLIQNRPGLISSIVMNIFRLTQHSVNKRLSFFFLPLNLNN